MCRVRSSGTLAKLFTVLNRFVVNRKDLRESPSTVMTASIQARALHFAQNQKKQHSRVQMHSSVLLR